MRFRDRVVIVVLTVSIVLACLVWHPVGHWAALVVVVAGVLLSGVVYRLRAPAFGLHDPIRVPGIGPQDEACPAVGARPSAPTGAAGAPRG